jgi:protein-tyrosine phosphatase
MHPQLKQALETGVYPITRRIAIGQFATRERSLLLQRRGVTHVFNVGEAPSVLTTGEFGFRGIVDVPIIDLTPIPEDTLRRCLDTIHSAMSDVTARLYIHCVACQNRSPTVLWLYLNAIGMPEAEAARLITDRCPDAIPGHGELVDESLLELARDYGRRRLPSITDPAIGEPAY